MNEIEEDEDKRIEDGTLETQLFSWDGWDGDHECMIYYNPILKVQIGKYPAGTKFDSASILFDKSILQFYSKDSKGETLAEYKLNLTVGETLHE